jgi:hypothetical protein
MLSAYNAGPAGGLQQGYVDTTLKNAQSYGSAPSLPASSTPVAQTTTSKAPTLPKTTESLDTGAFEKARKAAVLGKLLSSEKGSSENPLLASGLATTKMPNPLEYQHEVVAEHQGNPIVKFHEGPKAGETVYMPKQGESQAPLGPGSYGSLAGSGLTFAGPDQGIDFTGKGTVRAPADLKITRVASNTGWSGEGNIVVGQITSGPNKGRYMYIAEDFQPGNHVRPGAVLKEGEAVGMATGSGKAPGIEVGFAQDAHGTAYGTTHDGKAGGPSPVHGIEFGKYIQSKRGKG